MEGTFRDRRAAGRALAEVMDPLASKAELLVLGLPRGGVPVAYELAKAWRRPLDVLVVRKVGVPGHEELAMGAIASGDVRIVNERVKARVGISDEAWEEAAAHALAELGRRERRFRGERPPLEVAGRSVVLVDDGLATGSTMRAAIAAVKKRSAAEVIVGVPVAAASAAAAIAKEVDRFFCVSTPEPFEAVGLWYDDFSQTQDDEVCGLLASAGWVDRPPEGSR